MKKVICFKNDTGFGPTKRPRLEVGEVFKCVLMPDNEERTLVVVQVTNDAGKRCEICDMMHKETPRNDGTWDCLINNRSLQDEYNCSGAICTLRYADGIKSGVYAVFKNVDSLLEEL